MKKVITTLIPLCTIAFFCFILWVIYLANTGQHSIFFQIIAGMPYGDKLGHFCLFGVLTLATNLAFKFKSFNFYSMQLFLGTILVFSFVVIEEFSQYFIPNRSFDLIDLSADFIGIAFFTFVTSYLNKIKLRSKSSLGDDFKNQL
ncbi:VanZ family protein [Colwellia psychrerythraea]|uniref:VanZ family protein n=1 Tax=Colwellia psychrerythraea TaxID=28229 RepID=A0A099KZ45_COLPS|nr:VanZ family protein [Colwellia psychrerythraea]KGJ96014.1 VanZ family protein [Colwellia psychrerythraea]